MDERKNFFSTLLGEVPKSLWIKLIADRLTGQKAYKVTYFKFYLYKGVMERNEYPKEWWDLIFCIILLQEREVEKRQYWESKWLLPFFFFKYKWALRRIDGRYDSLWQCLEEKKELLPVGGISDSWVLLGTSAFSQIKDFRNSNAFSSK